MAWSNFLDISTGNLAFLNNAVVVFEAEMNAEGEFLREDLRMKAAEHYFLF